MQPLKAALHKTRYLFEREIWKPEHLRKRSVKGYGYACLRMLGTTWTVFHETKAATRAAALSYSSMLGLGPLIAIAMLIAGFLLDKRDPDQLVSNLQNLFQWLTPLVSQSGKGQGDLALLLKGFITGTKSSTAGILGISSLIFIVLMLFTSVENAFNEIWGVRRGRSWLVRILYYWAIVTLGALLFFTSLTALGASAFINASISKLHIVPGAITLLKWSIPIAAVLLVILVLTLFYRYVPNTHVFWRAALMGAIVVTALIYLNNVLAFAYFRRVLSTRSLYGSVSIIPILLMGLYVFWLFVLVGGQVSYAIQNMHLRNSQAAWGKLPEKLRERLSLAVLLALCRRFQAGKPASSAAELGEQLRVPTQLVNECLNRLQDMQFIEAAPASKGSHSHDYRFQPSRPLSAMTLQDFKRMEEKLGLEAQITPAHETDPLLHRYLEEMSQAHAGPFFETSLDRLIKDHPLPARSGK